MTFAVLFLLVAVILFGIAAFLPAVGRVSLLAAGLFFFGLYFLLGSGGVHLA